MSKNILAGFVLAVALGLSLTACEDTKAREETEQLKAQVSQLQKDIGGLGNRIDVLMEQNAELSEEIDRQKKRHPTKKTPKSKAHRSTSGATGSQN